MLAQSAKLEAQNHWVLSAFEQKQPRRLLMALVLLLVALTIVVVKDREFWFSPDEATDADSTAGEPASVPATVPAPLPSSAVSSIIQTPSVPASPAKKQITAKALINKPSTEESSTGKSFAEQAIANPGVVATTRTVLPPLSVEVVAGDMHRTLRPGSNAVKVEIPNSRSKPLPGPAGSTALVSAAGPATNAAELESMSPGIATAMDRSGSSSYPLLAQSARVEGSVVLQALIGSDGVIRDLRVLSGPAILASAAQQAVRQWRFKPYLQNGLAVETRANITVSFTIKVSDNSKSS